MILSRALETSNLQALLRQGETGQPPAGRRKAVHLGGRLKTVYVYSIEISPGFASSCAQWACHCRWRGISCKGGHPWPLPWSIRR